MDRRQRIIANKYEAEVHTTINEVVDKHSCVVFPKVRLADALRIDRSGLEDDAYSYALKAHLDFLIADSDSLSRFAVEFDGPSHDKPDRRRKDAMKNDICERLGLPLLRVKAKYLDEQNETISLLAWLIDIWFIFHTFLEAQSEGYIPIDEPFGYVHSSFDYFKRYRSQLWASYHNGKLISPPEAYVHTFDPAVGEHVARYFLQMSDGSFLVGEAACKPNGLYPISSGELAPELAMVEAVKQISRMNSDQSAALSRAQAKAMYMDFQKIIKRNKLRYGFGAGPFPPEP